MTTTPTLKDLRPTENTSAAIRAAYFRLIDARRENEAAMQEGEITRSSLIKSGSAPAEIRKVGEKLADRKIFSEQLDILEAELRRTFAEVKDAEDDQAYAARLSEIRAVEAAWNADMGKRYPALYAALSDLMSKEVDLLAQYADLARMPAAPRALNRLGDDPRVLASGMLKVKAGARFHPQHLHDAVALPALVSVV